MATVQIDIALGAQILASEDGVTTTSPGGAIGDAGVRVTADTSLTTAEMIHTLSKLIWYLSETDRWGGLGGART